MIDKAQHPWAFQNQNGVYSYNSKIQKDYMYGRC